MLGFVAGVLLDLAPPADHVAGRWALALVVVGLRRRPDASEAGAAEADTKPSVGAVVATVAASSFVGHLDLRDQRAAAAGPGRCPSPTCSR